MFEIIFSETAKKQFSKLPTETQVRIGRYIERIKIRPHAFLERLVNSPYFKGRVGDYRIIMDIRNEQLIIMIVEIGHRKNIYL